MTFLRQREGPWKGEKKGAFCPGMGALKDQWKEVNMKSGGKDRQNPRDRRVWNIRELSEAGDLGERRKRRRARGALEG